MIRLKKRHVSKAALRFIIPAAVLLVIISAAFAKSSRSGFSEEGKAGGVISKTDTGFVFELKDIFSAKGENIDYISDVELAGDMELTVDSSEVDTGKAGDYTAVYTVTDGKCEESYEVMVKIRDEQATNDSEYDSGDLQQNIKTEEVIDGNREYPVIKSQTAEIELMSGKKVKIPCTTARYIESTETESYNTSKKGIKYKVTELIVNFSTGEKRVLETVQKKID